MKAYMRHIPFLVVLAIVSLVMTQGDRLDGRPKAGKWVELSPAMEVPDATMQVDAEGGRASLKGAQGKVVLLNLWATWCAPCIKELPTLKKLHDSYENQGLKVVTLSVDSLPYAQVEGFVKNKLKLELPILGLDDSGELQKIFSAPGLPVTYLITRDGRVTHRFIGATDWLEEEALAPIKAALAK